MNDFSKLEEILGYKFNKKELLNLASTHSSYANECYGDVLKDNERLEFLGDAVLEMVISNALFNSELSIQEGELTKQRASIVCEKSLAKISKETKINEFLLLGKGEMNTGGATRDSIVSDYVEALIGAIYLDGGYNAASEVIMRLFESTIADVQAGRFSRDSKTELQELLQAQGPCTIEYVMLGESGPDHDKLFSFAVKKDGTIIGQGQGKSKKEAQASAAEAALRNL